MEIILMIVLFSLIALGTHKKSKPRRRYTNGQYMHKVKLTRIGKEVGEFYL